MSDFRKYIEHGWGICGIERGKKSPAYPGWNTKSIPLEAADGLDGAGLLHALSGTAALDIDDLETARPWLLERGVDVDALMADPAAVMVSSGRHNRAKLLYRLKRPMRTLKPTGSGVELRCATADGKSVQDVLPPTVHPDTKRPYQWKYGDPLVGHWSHLPPMPASLLALWRGLLAEIPAETAKTSPRIDASIETVRKAIYNYIRIHNKDVADYADWLEIGMRLHEQTGGAADGLDIWDEWSATDESLRENGQSRYQGRAALQVKWDSFSSVSSKRTVGMGALIAQMPAEKDEFENEEAGDSRPFITLQSGELHNYAAQCERMVSDDIYVRERQLVRIGGANELAPERSGAVHRDGAQAVVIPATPEYIRRRLNQRARFRSYRRREKEYVQVDCPKDLALNIAGQGDWPTLRQLKAIATAPFVRPDGSICETPGYDEASSVFYQPNSDFPSVPVNPTRKDAERALAVLLEPFSEFPFASGAARSGLVSHILTEIVRPAINTSPAFIYTAPVAGTGKTLLSEMPSRIVHGYGPALRPWAESGEELRKNLFSSLLAGDRTIAFDNLTNGAKLRSPNLCIFLTADSYSDRKLGVSDAPAMPNRSVVSVTGNNVTPSGDLARRSIVIRLDANTAGLRDRRFRIVDIRAYIDDNRSALLVAGLTIVRAYVVSGEASDKAPLPSFERWSGLVREPLLWLGMADPVATQDDEADDEATPLAEAFVQLAGAFVDQEFMASDITRLCDPLFSDEDNPLLTAIEAAGCASAIDQTRIGYWLREKRDQIAGGLKLVRGADTKGSRKWRLRKVPS